MPSAPGPHIHKISLSFFLSSVSFTSLAIIGNSLLRSVEKKKVSTLSFFRHSTFVIRHSSFIIRFYSYILCKTPARKPLRTPLVSESPGLFCCFALQKRRYVNTSLPDNGERNGEDAIGEMARHLHHLPVHTGSGSSSARFARGPGPTFCSIPSH